MNKGNLYKIINCIFGSPPIGELMYWDESYDAWVVKDAYNTGSECCSMWTGNPEMFPEEFLQITPEEADKIKLEKRKKLLHNCSECGNYLGLNDNDAGSEREMMKLCKTCYDNKKIIYLKKSPKIFGT